MITVEELDFLRESNNIEDEWDDKSLQDAILAWQYCKRQKKLNAKIIREVHSMLMQTRDTIEKEDKGAFRNGAVYIGGHEAKPWFVIPEMIDQWCYKMNHHVRESNRKRFLTYDPEGMAKEHHVEYEAIHPFFDGNGRTGRIFYNWERLKIGLPIHTIHYGKEQKEYYKWFA